ncbi:cystatin C (amyloid angiopathy and cerebral hemorrhage) [Danio aesculapii]|uniref:cystatin C (amyloid angiopathy and cerebral hemorrhage) n=1 Tax=Danio aesculapii TaxID=1142201 RepID=UPI0024BF13A4|nr:cystatin C (amyloid angiopathy and cerebral hemorrhage) [Danio aesculapii]
MFLKMIVAFLAVILTVSSAGLVGGPMDADMDKESQSALQFAMTQYNRQSNDAYVSDVSRVTKLQKQVVAGIKYIFTVDVARTTCRKGGVEELCAIHKNPDIAQVKECKIVVWTKSWESFIKVTENSCL